MSHFWKFSAIAVFSLVFFTPLVSHAQVEDWDYDRIDALVEELEAFEDAFEGVGSFDDIEDQYDEVLEYLEDFNIPDPEPIIIEPVSTSVSATNDYGTFTIKFDVTAVDDDFCVARTAGDDIGMGAQYRIWGDVDQKIVQSAVLTSTAGIRNNCFKVEEGETEMFTLTVVLNPERTGVFAVGLRSVSSANNYRVLIEEDSEYDLTTKNLTISGDANARDTYRGYLDGKLFITTRNITEAGALENCMLNATKNADKSIRCTWGTKEIYRKDVVAPVSGSISTKSLTESSRHVISGTAKNTPTVGLIIGGQYGDKVYASTPIPVSSSGKWSVKVPGLAAGSYTLTLLGEKDGIYIASGLLSVNPMPLVLPSPKQTVPAPSTEDFTEPLVLPAETNLKSSVSNTSLSASAGVAFEQFLKAFESYLSSR